MPGPRPATASLQGTKGQTQNMQLHRCYCLRELLARYSNLEDLRYLLEEAIRNPSMDAKAITL